MIEVIRKLLKPATTEATEQPSDIDLAAAALLIEVMVIDEAITPEEENTIKTLLGKRLNINQADSTALFDAARKEVSQATSLFQFTRQINDEFSDQQKYQLVEELWEVAYADQQLDRYEEHIIRRISELIHLPHSAFIKAKSAALAKMNH